MTDNPVGAELHGCDLCGAIGLEERVKPWNHDCEYFRGDDRSCASTRHTRGEN